MVKVAAVRFGDVLGYLYIFDKVGDMIPMHGHDRSSAHASIVIKGSIKHLNNSTGINSVHGTGCLLNFADTLMHEIRALEDDTRLFNILKYQIGTAAAGNKYLIRFNKTRGENGRGSKDHVWRVFENDKEFIVKHVRLLVPSHDEQSGGEWNISCRGYMHIDDASSTATISAEATK